MTPLTHARIGDLADVSTGFAARTALETAVEGGVRALQAGALPPGSAFAEEDVEGPRVDVPGARAMLRAGDVVFNGRGDVRATVYRGADGAVLAIGPLIVLRVRVDALLPSFLALQLTVGPVSDRLRGAMRGSSARFVGKADVAGAEILVPDLATQERLAELRQLMDRERALADDLSDRRVRLLGALVGRNGRQRADA